MAVPALMGPASVAKMWECVKDEGFQVQAGKALAAMAEAAARKKAKAAKK